MVSNLHTNPWELAQGLQWRVFQMKCTCDLCPKHSILFAYGPVTACTNEATSSFIGEETGKRWDVCPECDKHAYNANEGMFGVALDEDLEGNPRKV